MSTPSQRYRRRRARTGKVEGAPVELIEEAFHLLRTAPVGTLWIYYLGTVPFVIVAFYFWADMSRSSHAPRDAAFASLGAAMAYFWMKGWQGLFCRRLWEQLNPAGSPVRLGWKRGLRYLAAQVFLQALSWPVRVVSTLFLGWAIAFFQSVSVFAFTRDYGRKPLRHLIADSARMSHAAWGQNHLMLLVLSGIALFTFLNLFATAAAIPTIIKAFFGVETVFTLSPMSTLLNSTFLFAVLLLCYLALDPFFKAVYTLRGFYGVSRATGADLLSRLATLRAERGLGPVSEPDTPAAPAASPRPAPKAALFVLGVTSLTLLAATAAGAQEAPIPDAPPSAAPTPDELRSSIEETLRRKPYQWRMPRQTLADADDPEAGEQSWLARRMTEFANSVENLFKAIGDWIDDLLNRRKPRPKPGGDGLGAVGEGIGAVAKLLLFLGLGALIAWIIFILAKHYRQPVASAAIADGASGPVDLESENIVASQLPEDEWMRLAREQIAKGEHRLAIRALFLASLVHLGERGLLKIARFKSNRDYTRELELKARALPEVRSAFGENVGLFEWVWYGLHEIGDDAVDRFTQNYERLAWSGAAATEAPAIPS
ncbi:MAG: DUF4129 domain-containing protein [Akkermansiaceae bacterium]|nr:DUF4129 domain-containing protein [Akkermansiaceae bacterium]